MKRLRLIIPAVLLCATLGGCGAKARNIGQPLPARSISFSYSDFFSNVTPQAPADDGAYAMPTNAMTPVDSFEGRLDLVNPSGNGSIVLLRDDYGDLSGGDSPSKHLAAFSFEFVQDGGYLIPAQQGLVYTGNPAWNYIIGPGRVWQQSDDSGYTRASFPFALIMRNQNCVHNGEMTFLFSSSKSPNISNVRYQITQETCEYIKFNLWGQISAKYTPYSVANDAAIKSDHAAEIANRLPTKPLSTLTTDFPGSGFNVAGLTRTRQYPQDVTMYGLLVNGVNYVSGCQTRYGEYAFCSEMRVPSYSTAKTVFNSLAMMRLGQLYGSGVYSQLIRNYVPEYTRGGDWSTVTFDNGSDMATGNYESAAYMADEEGADDRAFLGVESYTSKVNDAFRPFPHRAAPGTTWVYQDVATFITNHAMDNYLKQQQGGSADIFNLVRNDVYKPIEISQGGLTALRTDNSANGKPLGCIGLFYIQDDVAKIGKLLNNDHGMVNGSQILDPVRLQDSMFQNPSTMGLLVPDTGTPVVPNTLRYNNNFWAKKMTRDEYPQYGCDFWLPFMNGFGGITIALLPNGTTFYVFSDAGEPNWVSAVNESNKLSPMCH